MEAYKKAVQVDGAQVYAWQGVISVYEKQNVKSHPDLLDAYKRVATHFEKDDKQKYIENTLKLANILISQQDGTKALKVIARLAKSAGLNLEIAQLLVLLLNNTTSETRSPDEDGLYTDALEVLVTQTPQPAEETYRKYFSQLYRNKFYEKLAQRCIGIEDQWNYYYSPMEWICRLYLETNIDPQTLGSLGGIEKITDKLFKLHPSSRNGYFARGKYLIEESCKYVEGFNWINNALESSYNLHAALVLVRGKLKFGDYEGALEEAAKGVANSKSETEFETLFDLLYLEGLIGTSDTERAEEQRLKLEETFSQSPDHPQYPIFLDLSVRTLLKKKEYSELGPYLSSIGSLASNDFPSWKLDFYNAIAAAVASQEKFKVYLKSCLDTYGEEPDLMLQSSIFLFENEDYETAADILSSLVKTAEGNSHPHTWKYLGKLAEIEGDLQKAAKYLKKSYELNLDSEVGASLSDIYHEIDELGLKKALLIDASKKVRKTKSKWVWSRLGLMYLEEGDLLQAVECLQSAIRVDLEDGFLWESLADAYFYRGSLHAALRCYNKALEHGVDPIYPKMRMSTIYQFLEEEDRSIAGLKQLLEENPQNTPLQLELARLYCWVASEKIKENFDTGAVSSAEKGLNCVVKAVMHSSKPMLLPWLIIGDYSITLNGLPESIQIQVPTLLVQSQGQDINPEEVLKPVTINLLEFKEIGTKALLQCLLTMTTSPEIEDKIKDSPSLLAYIYHQLALSFYNRSNSMSDDKERKQCILTALQYCKLAILKAQHNSMYWNTIGLIDFKLSNIVSAQHCFIRSLQTDPNNVMAWGNLGMLYYHQGEFLLSHKAFAKGQSVAPIYANSWIGQALCAEVLQPSEAVDLFRHACLLRPHPFAVSSYGNAICDLLLNPEEINKLSPEDYNYLTWHLLTRMDAVTHLYDLISRVERRAPSPHLFNLKGLVAGWNGFYQTALESFNMAMEYPPTKENLTVEEKLVVHSNKVSSLVSMKKFPEAKDELMTFPTLDAIGLANAALALFKMEQVSTAIGMYKRILELPVEEKKKSNVKIALAVLVHQAMNVDSAKTILFGKDMMKNPRALLTLGAIAVSQSDLNLLRAVIHELRSSQWTPQLAADIAFMKVCHEILQKSFKSAVKAILQLIHMHPTNPRLYALACQVVITYNLENFHVSVPRHLALCTLKMARIVGTSREENAFASKHSGVVSLTYLFEYNVNVAIMATLKAIKCYPEHRDNWAVLACAYWMQYTTSKNPRLVLNIVNILDREIELEICSKRIRDWMMSFRVEIAKYCQSNK